MTWKDAVSAGVLGFAVLASGASPLSAQTFGDRVDVTEIEIPVRVVRNGVPVLGLEAEDFEVRMDGKAMEIVGFSVLEAEEPRSRGAATEVRGAPSDRPSDEVTRRPRHVLLFFDFVFAEPRHLRRAFDGVRVMIDEQLGPDDRVAVAYLSTAGARILVGFTRDRDEALLGIDLVEGLLHGQKDDVRQAAHRLEAHLEERSGESELAFLSERFGATAALTLGRDLTAFVWDPHGYEPYRFDDGPAASSSVDPVLGSVVASSPEAIAEELAGGSLVSLVRLLALEMARFATMLEDIPSPKEVLYLSEGYPSAVLETFDSQDRAPALRHLERMHEALIRGGWVVHGVDVEGIPSSGVDVAEATAASPGPSRGTGFRNRGFDALALFQIANETGGQVLENYNRVEQATESLLRPTRVTYLLTGLANDLAADGRKHRIDVDLRDRPRGTRIHHRPAYYAPRPAESLDPLERELQLVRRLLGDEHHDELGMDGHAAVAASKDGSSKARFLLAVPPRVVDPSGNAGVDLLEVRVFALDARGGALSTWSRRIRLDLSEVGDRLAEGGMWLTGTIEAPATVHRLRVLVRSSARGASSLLTLPVEDAWRPPSSPDPRGLVLKAG